MQESKAAVLYSNNIVLGDEEKNHKESETPGPLLLVQARKFGDQEVDLKAPQVLALKTTPLRVFPDCLLICGGGKHGSSKKATGGGKELLRLMLLAFGVWRNTRRKKRGSCSDLRYSGRDGGEVRKVHLNAEESTV
jgi:hypothetical protein